MSAYTPSGAERFRLQPGGPANPTLAGSALTALSTPSHAGATEGNQWHPNSPLFWFGTLAAVTFGLMAVSTSGTASMRLGHTTATVSAGGGVGKA